MTSLSGEFQTDLGIDDAMVACTEAIDGLGWRIDTVDAQRVIAFTDAGKNPPRIEVNLNESGGGTEFRIIGSDNEQNQLEQDDLIAVLDKARDAINRSMEDAERPRKTSARSAEGQTEERQPAQATDSDAAATPAGWYPDVYDDSRERYWDGEQWTDDFRPVDDGGEQAQAEQRPEKKSRKEAREEKRQQTRERAEQRRQERLEKRQEKSQQSGAAVGGAAAGGAAAGAATSREVDSSEGGSEQGNTERPSASGIAAIATSNDFRSLHLIATLYQYLGYVVVVGGAIAVIVSAASAGGGGGIGILIGGAIGVAFYALLVFGIAAAIRLALAVEKNTRDTAELLRRDRGA
jgi:hypothetical protein